MTKTLLEVKNLKKHFPIQSGLFQRTVGHVKAVDDVSFYVNEGETLGLVGESGCGKSTTGRMIVKLLDPTEGEVFFEGQDIARISQREMKKYRREIQMVFQDPYASLNPRKTVGYLLEEPFVIHDMYTPDERRDRVKQLLEVVGLNGAHYDRYPHEFSGGQRQRIGIARALTLKPKLIVADEPVSALDVSVQSQVLNLMSDLQDEFNLTYIFIAHDLSVVKHISDRVGVMYLGKMAEIGPNDHIYSNPLHPYTQSLLSAVPIPNPKMKRERIILKGDVPSPSNPPKGCVFHTRCPKAMDHCKTIIPVLQEVEKDHYVSCHLYS
jgi:oligopeptide transport system ATP-binding protein